MQGQAMFERVLTSSWQASVLIVLVLLLQRVLRHHLSARWRAAFWLLVLGRLLLPIGPNSSWSLFHYAQPPTAASLTERWLQTTPPDGPGFDESRAAQEAKPTPQIADRRLTYWASWLWLAGVVTLTLRLLAQNGRFAARLRRGRVVEDPEVLRLLDECRDRIGVRTPLRLVETDCVRSPALYGAFRWRLLLPPGLLNDLTTEQQRCLLLHELAHLKRCDPLVNWLLVLLRAVHWFNPLVWYAYRRVRRDRELACDEAVLSRLPTEVRGLYGLTIVRLLELGSTLAKSQALMWKPTLTGIVEDREQIEERIHMIAKFKSQAGRPFLAALLFAGLGVTTLTDARSQTPADRPAAVQELEVKADKALKNGVDTGPGRPLISSKLETIRLDKVELPNLPLSEVVSYLREESQLRDAEKVGIYFIIAPRELADVLIKIEPALRDVRLADLLDAIVKGADHPIQYEFVENVVVFSGKVVQTPQAAEAPAPKTPSGAAPRIVSTSPIAGATDVDPALKEITVTFDCDMAKGFSWTGSGPQFPPSPEGEKASWRDRRTCVLPVKLEPRKYYRVGINSTSYRNFKSAEGVPVDPSAIYFTTKGAGKDLVANSAKPQVVKFDPTNGARDVDPGLKELRVTFNVPMGRGFSWTGSGPQHPESPEGKRPYWTADQKTCVLPVALQPNWEYRVGLNSRSYKNFQSASGVPLEPVVYTFKTR